MESVLPTVIRHHRKNVFIAFFWGLIDWFMHLIILYKIMNDIFSFAKATHIICLELTSLMLEVRCILTGRKLTMQHKVVLEMQAILMKYEPRPKHVHSKLRP